MPWANVRSDVRSEEEKKKVGDFVVFSLSDISGKRYFFKKNNMLGILEIVSDNFGKYQLNSR